MGSYHYFYYTLKEIYSSQNIMKKDELRILQVGNVLVSPDIITENSVATLMPARASAASKAMRELLLPWMRLWRLRMRWM